MKSQSALGSLLGQARLRTYLLEAGGDLARATDLYLWATHLSGALHGQISFVEIAARNAIDARLKDWNVEAGFGTEWTAESQAAQPLYVLLRRGLIDARWRAARECAERRAAHPRSGSPVTHDDVVAQLMFGSWVSLIRPISTSESAHRQQRLWAEALSLAFPHAAQDDEGRRDIGRKLEVLRRLRNRVAHHDNLLRVDLQHRLNGMLSLLSKMDADFPALATGRSTLRRLIREDPRRAW